MRISRNCVQKTNARSTVRAIGTDCGRTCHRAAGRSTPPSWSSRSCRSPASPRSGASLPSSWGGGAPRPLRIHAPFFASLFLHPRKRCCILSPVSRRRSSITDSPDLRSAHSARVGHLEGFTQIWPQFQTLRASTSSPTHPTGRTLKSFEESRPQKCDLSLEKGISIDDDGDDDGRRTDRRGAVGRRCDSERRPMTSCAKERARSPQLGGCHLTWRRGRAPLGGCERVGGSERHTRLWALAYEWRVF